jgi:hypothetical protein
VSLPLANVPDTMRVTFDTPVPEGVVYVGRNHWLVEALAEHLMDHAFYPSDAESPAARCGAIRTDVVARRTTLLLLRLRFLIHERSGEVPNLAEETIAWGYEGLPPETKLLSLEQARALVDTACPTANLSLEAKRGLVAETLAAWKGVQPALHEMVSERAVRLEGSHRRIRTVTRAKPVRFEPKMPPDLLGVLVLVPVPKGVA